MSLLNNPEILRQIIMDHYEFPRNHELTEDETYAKKHMASDSCIDDIYVQSKITNGKVEDVRFDGTACTIATSSTSIMSELMIGKDVKEALAIIQTYYDMIDGKTFDEEMLEEAIAFSTVGKQANRIKCATIGWKAMEEMLKESEANDK